MEFPTKYEQILQRMQSIDPIRYGQTRNYLNGGVTYLSPYISRGVISTKMVLQSMLEKGVSFNDMESLIQELCWRDYFQRVAQSKEVQQDLKFLQVDVLHDEIPSNVIHAKTGIQGVDLAIQQLMETGYMHNHARMYVASIVCNLAKTNWRNPSKWMYYYLLDADFASNSCSWQWVAGANSQKKYFANQENVNRYLNTHQTGTFLDKTYEKLAQAEVPEVLIERQKHLFQTELPNADSLTIDVTKPTFIYTFYNLDPIWHSEEKGNRILLLEPAHFDAYPISKLSLDFMLSLSENIPGMQVYVGSFESFISSNQLTGCYYKEHPLNAHFSGNMEQRDWICPEVCGYFPSFFAYWKKVKKQLTNSMNLV